MKATILTWIAVISFGVCHIHGQIPNGNFEEWEIPNTWNWEPVGWETPNSQLIEVVVQDSFAYEGNLAMRVKPLQGFETAAGAAMTEFPINLVPGQLDFAVRNYIPDGSIDSVGVIVSLFESQDALYPIYSVKWFTTQSISEWTPIALDLDPSVVGATTCRIVVFAGYNGPLGGGPASTWIAVDDMSLDYAIGLNPPIEEPSWNVWVSRGELHVTGPQVDEHTQLELLDLSGRTVKHGLGSEMKCEELNSGIYLLRVANNNQPVKTVRVYVN
ncbi:MAG: T9SS type A sorting domain-containing protein [Flavobacteriales bacterium]|nr:T9SS type A sorting domain-containing protein [Flavobacteriales bacterium]